MIAPTRLVLALGLVVLVACGADDHVELLAVAPSTTSSSSTTAPSPVVADERDPLHSTTTTTSPPRPVTTHVSRGGGRTYRGNPTGTYNGYPCGGDLPPCSTLERESHGHPTAVNRTGCGGRTCGGLWQFDPVTFIPGCTVSRWKKGTCGTYQGYRFGQDAPAGVQNERAREVWDHGRGCGHWAACA